MLESIGTPEDCSLETHSLRIVRIFNQHVQFMLSLNYFKYHQCSSVTEACVAATV